LDFVPFLQTLLFHFDSIEGSSSGWISFDERVLLEEQEPQTEAEILSNFRAQNAQAETTLFRRYKTLKGYWCMAFHRNSTKDNMKA
jgi:hypothetical protein